jgi:hypothetical protein
MIKYKVWLDSGANIKSCREQEITVEELGYSDEEWNEKSNQDQEDELKQVAFDHADWGFQLIKGE